MSGLASPRADPAKEAAQGDGGGFGLYIHWPFCQAKCPYCDFNSHVVPRIDQSRWADALAGDIRRVAEITRDRPPGSVFFGGGTPSLMTPETVATIMEAVRDGWSAAPDLEVTMEANPTSVEAANFAGYRAAGVNRLSLGVQALNDADLRRLGRLHDVAEARAAFDVARATFERVSFDLICARQDQTRAAWEAELATALAMAVDHISLYQLAIEPGTAFAERHARGGLRGLPDEDLGADLYEMTVEMCEKAGLACYEVSNFARPGAESRHNLLYWSGGDYAGVGPGAHGRLTLGGTRHATEQERMPQKWLAAIAGGRTAHETQVALSRADWATEYIMMGLRKSIGLDMVHLDWIKPSPDGFHARVSALEAEGLVVRVGQRLRTTARGRLLLDAIISELTEG